MRILVGGVNHESNSLNPIITGKDDFVVFRGKQILEEGMKPYYSSTGIIEACRRFGWEIVPVLVARAVPNGLVSAAFYASLKQEFLDGITAAKKSGPIDGVCLALHGSMKVEGLGPAEGDLVSAIRKLLPEVPITAALDMHATMTDELLRGIDAFVGYKTAPHVDCSETGAHAAQLLKTALESGKKLTMASRKIPFLIAGEQSETQAEPMRSLIDACVAAEKEEGVLAASILLGFPWADYRDAYVTTLVVTLSDREKANRLAVDLAREFWRKRGEFSFRSEHYDSSTALAKALQAVQQRGLAPVFVSDSGDNPTAGAAGDATELFEHVLASASAIDKLPTPLLYSGFFDAEAASKSLEAGEGATLDLKVGGRWDKVNGKRIPLTVKVLKTVKDFGPYHSSLALLQYRNIRLVVTSKHIGFGDEELLPALGVNAQEYCLVVVKLGYLEDCFRSIAALAILALSKGCSNEVLESIPYRSLPRPIYPLDKTMSYFVE
jgi:microcystin degradation protein MlrC